MKARIVRFESEFAPFYIKKGDFVSINTTGKVVLYVKGMFPCDGVAVVTNPLDRTVYVFMCNQKDDDIPEDFKNEVKKFLDGLRDEKE